MLNACLGWALLLSTFMAPISVKNNTIAPRDGYVADLAANERMSAFPARPFVQAGRQGTVSVRLLTLFASNSLPAWLSRLCVHGRNSCVCCWCKWEWAARLGGPGAAGSFRGGPRDERGGSFFRCSGEWEGARLTGINEKVG